MKCRRQGAVIYAEFCSPACTEAYKVQLAHLRASHLEQVYGERLCDAGLAFVPQYPLGPYVVDLAFPQVRLLVEVDGEVYHAGPRTQMHDDCKDALAAVGGWCLLLGERLEEAVRWVVEAFQGWESSS
ncbi:DUF559 domain-containing protein [Deinococcus terrestris]|uniref:DUF559 domain-containing protein n=1 Tax=Deinococcus terrestris TaxID=2651870 RepID=UPI0018846B4F|nr:DUF559 domain-containing protein [Deinococcus terrestris]